MQDKHGQPGMGRLQPPCMPPPGCCRQRVPGPPKRAQPLGPSEATASSATRPMTSLGTYPAASTAATPSARRVCGGWTRQPTSSAGSPARSAARAHPRPAEGWPCWTSTWPPSWPSGPSGSCLAQNPSPPRPSKAAPPSLSSRPGFAPPWAPSPTSPSPDAAAGAAAASAGTPRAAPRPELRPVCSTPAQNLWRACSEQPGSRVSRVPLRVFTPGPQPKVGSCVHSTVSPCRSWNPSQDSQAPRWSVCRGGVLLSESPASPARVQTQLRGWLLKGSGAQTPGTGLQAGAAGPGRSCSRSCGSRSPLLYRAAQRREPRGRAGVSLHPWPVRQPCDVRELFGEGPPQAQSLLPQASEEVQARGGGTCLRGCSGQPLPCQALSFLLPPGGHQTDPSEGPEHVLETVDADPTNWAAASPPPHRKEPLGGTAGPAPGSGWQGRTRECAERTLRTQIGRASVGKECLRLCRSRWSPYH